MGFLFLFAVALDSITHLEVIRKRLSIVFLYPQAASLPAGEGLLGEAKLRNEIRPRQIRAIEIHLR